MIIGAKPTEREQLWICGQYMFNSYCFEFLTLFDFAY